MLDVEVGVSSFELKGLWCARSCERFGINVSDLIIRADNSDETKSADKPAHSKGLAWS